MYCSLLSGVVQLFAFVAGLGLWLAVSSLMILEIGRRKDIRSGCVGTHNINYRQEITITQTRRHTGWNASSEVFIIEDLRFYSQGRSIVHTSLKEVITAKHSCLLALVSQIIFVSTYFFISILLVSTKDSMRPKVTYQKDMIDSYFLLNFR